MLNDDYAEVAATAAVEGAQPEEPRSMQSVNSTIDALDLSIAGEELRPATAPLYKWTPRQRQALYSMVGSVAQSVERRIIRPSDPAIVSDLRRREAANHSSASAASISLYKTRSANPRYGTSGPLGWNEHQRVKFASGASRGTGEEETHKHTVQLSLLPDIRFLRDKPHLLYEPFDEVITSQNPHIPYLCVSQAVRTALSALNPHAALTQFAESLRESRQIMSLGEFLQLASNNHGLTLHGVVFRHDNAIEAVFALDLDCHYFGVMHLRLAKLQQSGVYRRQANQRSEAGREVRERTLRELRTAVAAVDDPPTIGSVAAQHRVEQMVAAVASRAGATETETFEFFDFSALGIRPPRASSGTTVPTSTATPPVTGLAPDSRDARLLARCMTLIVFDPRRAKTLNATAIQFAYHYFVTCQCAMKKRDLRRMKRLYGAAARMNPVDFAVSHTLPQFESDEETPNERIASSSSAAVQGGQLMDSGELAQQRYEQRYKPKRSRDDC